MSLLSIFKIEKEIILLRQDRPHVYISLNEIPKTDTEKEHSYAKQTEYLYYTEPANIGTGWS